MTRPPIPADLERRVLVEAGHRCAIPTCRNPDVDLHHIVPWEQCRSHDFDNLIALCPNCHRRAHNGEIDRKSLLMYKAQLPSAVGTLTNPNSTAVSTGAKISVRWSTQQIAERAKAGNPYNLEVEFPQFFPDEGELAEINVIQKAEALKLLHDCRRFSLGASGGLNVWSADLENVTVSSYEVLLFDRGFISIKYTLYEYGAGAAHGHSQVIACNYRLRPLVSLGAIDLFADRKMALEALSNYCIQAIETEKQAAVPDGWVRKGAAAEWGNFSCVNLVSHGLIVTFQEYQVGSYAEGKRAVFVPVYVVNEFLKPSLGLSEVWVGPADGA